MAVSITFIVSSVFMAYICHCVYSMFTLILPPRCSPGMTCYPYFTKMQPNLLMVAYVSDEVNPSIGSVQEVAKVDSFDPNDSWEREMRIRVPESTKKNGSMYLFVFLLKPQKRALSFPPSVNNKFHVYSRFPLIRFNIPSTNFELLKGEIPKETSKPVGFLKKEVAFNILMGVDEWPSQDIPPEIMPFFRLGEKKTILPIMEFDHLSDRFDKLGPVPQDYATVTLKYSPIKISEFRLRMHTHVAFKSLKQYGFSDKDLDQVKSLFSASNVYFLGLTVFVSSIHILFDFLAIKSDVSFWKSRKSLVGLSSRTVCWRAFSQVIVFLYLLDEGTSLLVLIPTGIGTAIEFWKVQKIMPIDWRKLKFKKVERTQEEEATISIDQTGMKYLLYLLYPLCLSGAVYSLFYLQHKSWYSWIIHSLVNGVYGFGFLFMLPQLFINYKLKSVAHTPWKSFMYKAFNTFIDDLFAFVIEMPTAHRIACFRDDVVFVVYLYQRWLYPVDKTRVEAGENE